MEHGAVQVGHGVDYKVKMHMVSICMGSVKNLMPRKYLRQILPSKIRSLFISYFLFGRKADSAMGIGSPSGLLSKKALDSLKIPENAFRG